MTELDRYVDALEDAIIHRGITEVDILDFVPRRDDASRCEDDETSIVVELFRVWMEHRWLAGYPTTAQECLLQFPELQFSPKDIADLEFEESRQRSAHSGGSNIHRTYSSRSGEDGQYESHSISDLPATGTSWDDFQLLGILGTGAFSKVYLARQMGLAGRIVALKLTFRKTNESRWLASLQHSAIVPIYSIHQSDGVYGICMPFLGNTTLGDAIRDPGLAKAFDSDQQKLSKSVSWLDTIKLRQRDLDTWIGSNSVSSEIEDLSTAPQLLRPSDREQIYSPTEHYGKADILSPAAQRLQSCSYTEAVCWIGAQLADALAYSHSAGVIHSDIKPANILLGSDGQPRLLDFNIAYAPESQKTFPLGGTLPYMSPEHRTAMDSSLPIDPRSDIYSLGVVLFESLTGKLPTHKLGKAGPRSLNPAVSPGLSAIVSKCLEAIPDKRYRTASELATDLNAQLMNQPLKYTEEPSWKEIGLKWCRRHPKLTSSSTVFAAFMVICGFLLTALWVRDAALKQAEWTNRLDEVSRRLPKALSLMSSLSVTPQLEEAASQELYLLSKMISSHDALDNSIDSRWKQLDKDDARVRGVEQLLWLSGQHRWKNETAIPRSLNSLLNSASQSTTSSIDILRYVKNGEFDRASRLLDDRIRRDSNDYFSWWLLGDCYRANDDLDKALQAYSVCVALQPTIAIGYFNRASVHFNKKQYDDAIADYESAYALQPSWSWIQLNRALALQALGKNQEALQVLDVGWKDSEGTVSVFRLRSELHASLGEHAASAADIQRAFLCGPQTEQHWIDRGLLELADSPANAANDFERAISLNPRSIDAYQKLAFVYSELLNRTADAVDLCTKLIELAPKQPTHRAARAVLNARLNRASQSLSDLAVLETSTTLEPIVKYQIACAYSILASKDDTESRETLTEQARSWFIHAVKSDASLLVIAETDVDISWLRHQADYSTILSSAKKLKLIP